jgi:hypothetical protein
MPFSIQDYLIDPAGIDWDAALAAWAWLLPEEFKLWFVNRFADLFLILPKGPILMLDVGIGTLTELAHSREDFLGKIDHDNNGSNWLLMPLVDRLAADGVRLEPGKCYGYKLPPVLGGEYAVENVAVLPIADYLGAYGSIHEELRNVPDGGQVQLKVEDPPKPPPDSHPGHA